MQSRDRGVQRTAEDDDESVSNRLSASQRFDMVFSYVETKMRVTDEERQEWLTFLGQNEEALRLVVPTEKALKDVYRASVVTDAMRERWSGLCSIYASARGQINGAARRARIKEEFEGGRQAYLDGFQQASAHPGAWAVEDSGDGDRQEPASSAPASAMVMPDPQLEAAGARAAGDPTQAGLTDDPARLLTEATIIAALLQMRPEDLGLPFGSFG